MVVVGVKGGNGDRLLPSHLGSAELRLGACGVSTAGRCVEDVANARASPRKLRTTKHWTKVL